MDLWFQMFLTLVISPFSVKSLTEYNGKIYVHIKDQQRNIFHYIIFSK